MQTYNQMFCKLKSDQTVIKIIKLKIKNKKTFFVTNEHTLKLYNTHVAI